MVRQETPALLDPHVRHSGRIEDVLRRRRPVKILGEGTLDRALTVQAQAFSEKARAAIEAAGGQAVVIE